MKHGAHHLSCDYDCCNHGNYNTKQELTLPTTMKTGFVTENSLSGIMGMFSWDSRQAATTSPPPALQFCNDIAQHTVTQQHTITKQHTITVQHYYKETHYYKATHFFIAKHHNNATHYYKATHHNNATHYYKATHHNNATHYYKATHHNSATHYFMATYHYIQLQSITVLHS